MKQKVIISAVQMKVLSAKKNLPKILNYIKKAADLKSNIVCFPECVFNPNSSKPSIEQDLDPIKKACKDNNIFAIINGYFKENKDVYNRNYIINNQGKVIGYYDKIHPWLVEIGLIKPGKQVKVFNTPFGKIGTCICWDIFFPSIFENLKKKGAEIIFCPSYWTDDVKTESNFIESVPVVMAYHYMSFFIFSNALFKSRTSITQIAGPWGNIAKIKFKEGIITAVLYSNRLKRFKKHFKPAFWERQI